MSTFPLSMQGEMPKRAVTGVEFFHRFPPLHAYLLGQLQEAVRGVQESTSRMHPSLYPILVLLSRLRNSTQVTSNAEVCCPIAECSWPGLLCAVFKLQHRAAQHNCESKVRLADDLQVDELSPAVFAPVVRQFALARPMAVRHLSAQALAPLVTPAQLGPVLFDILQSIPCSPPIASHNEVSLSFEAINAMAEDLPCLTGLFSSNSTHRRKVPKDCDGISPCADMHAAAWPQAHGSLLQARHLLEAHAPSLQPGEAHALLDEGAALLLDRMWLATPLSAASAIRAQYLRAAGALMSAAHAADPPAAGHAVPALARALMGVCQEAVIGQEQQSTAASEAPAMAVSHTETPADRPDSAPAIAASSAVQAGVNGSSEKAGSASYAEAAGADGADAMRSVFLKETTQLYFGPALHSLARSNVIGATSPSQLVLLYLLVVLAFPVCIHSSSVITPRLASRMSSRGARQ